MSEPVKPDDIDAVIHERVRLSIVAALAVSPQLGFNELKSMLELTDGNLSAHVANAGRGGLHRRREKLSRPPPLHGHASDAQGPQGVRALPGNLAADRRPRRPGQDDSS